MDRRSFLSSLIASGALYGAGGLPGFTRSAYGSTFADTGQKHLVSILLNGGPDFRHLMPPPHSTSESEFGYHYWRAMAMSHGISDDAADHALRWQNDYHAVTDGNTSFGILKSCGWLINMWDAGNVAVVNNVLTTSSRNHPLGLLVTEQGNRSVGTEQLNAAGWGGLVGDASQRNVLSLTELPRSFCYGAENGNPAVRSNNRFISASNTRSLALFDGNEANPETSYENAITRGVSSYYQAKSEALSAAPHTARFADQEQKLRQFGQLIDTRLAGIDIPPAIARLYEDAGVPLFSPEFGQQIRNLYDSFACADLLDMGIAALEYKGWDTHRAQTSEIEPRLNDLFGEQQGLDSLFSSLPASVRDNLVIVLNGEFGRQIRANGDGGTDHGEGGSVLLIGAPVNGGIYGDMFPTEEITRLDEPSPQISGRTGVERIYSRLADWLIDDTANVFGDINQAPIESGMNLSDLLG